MKRPAMTREHALSTRLAERARIQTRIEQIGKRIGLVSRRQKDVDALARLMERRIRVDREIETARHLCESLSGRISRAWIPPGHIYPIRTVRGPLTPLERGQLDSFMDRDLGEVTQDQVPRIYP